jgi:hypothetical protein
MPALQDVECVGYASLHCCVLVGCWLDDKADDDECGDDAIIFSTSIQKKNI